MALAYGWRHTKIPIAPVNPNMDYYPADAPGNALISVRNYTLYKNLMACYLRIGQNTRNSYWENFIIADNYKGDACTWEGEMERFLWVGGSDNYEPHPTGAAPAGAVGDPEGLVHLHTIYDGPIRVRNSYFAGVDYPEMSLFDQWGANLKYTGFTFRNTTIEPGSYQVNFRAGGFNNHIEGYTHIKRRRKSIHKEWI